jgi:hypothetical protein
MSAPFQSLIAAALCIFAGGYLALRAYLAFAKRAGTGCGSGCGSCPSAENVAGAKVKSLLSLEVPPTKDGNPGRHIKV